MTTKQTVVTPPVPSPLAVFRNRNFALMWAGQLVSTAGSALTSLAASILVFRLTGSALSVGLMLMATALPTLLVGLIAGVLVDRYDRKRIMIGANLIRAALVCLIPVLIPLNIAWLYIIVALSSAVGQFFDPAHESVLPEIASEEELAAANSMIAISSFGSTAIGFAASGLIASQFPIEWCFYLDALSFVFSAVCILLIHIAPLQAEGQTTVAAVVRNLGTGLQFLFQHTVLRSVFGIGVLYAVAIGLWNSLLLPFSLRALHANEFQYGVQEGLTSVGFVIGSLVMASWADRLREGQWYVISLAGMGLAGVAYAASRSIPLAIVMVMLVGLMVAPYNIARRLVVQRNTPREVRGRVNSSLFVTRDIFLLLGMAAAGLADVIDVRVMMLGSALLALATGALAAVMPGLGQPAAEWKRAMSLLRAAPVAPGLGAGRAATADDFDVLAGRLPSLAGLAPKERQTLMAQARVTQASPGTTIIRHGDTGDAAYFVLAGRAVAGIATEGEYRSLSTLTPGDFFGEIAALTGAPRTANVVADEPATLLQVPARALRELMSDPALSQLFLAKMSERLSRTHTSDLPRLAGLDQGALRDLRTPEPVPHP